MAAISIRGLAEQCLGETAPISLREDVLDIARRIDPTTSLRNRVNFIEYLCDPGPRPFYVIAHKINEVDDILPAIEAGANGIECDIRVDDGDLFVSHWPDFHWVGLVDYLSEMAEIAADRDELALVIFDCKSSVTAQDGTRLLDEIRAHLTSRIEGLNILISGYGAQLTEILRCG